MHRFRMALLAFLPLAVGQDFPANAPASGVIHFDDGRTLRFDDLRKFRFGVDPGQILLEPRGLYVQYLNTSLHLPAREIREIRVSSYRLAAGTTCQRPCGIAAAKLTVTTVGGLTAIASAGFADHFVIVARDDRYSDSVERTIPWARIGPNGALALNVRRITFDAR